MKKRRSGGRKAPTLAKLKARAWKLLSEVVRREAADANGMVHCYTCAAVHQWNSGDIQAGHAIGGRNGAVLLDEEIIRPQDRRCNIMLRGNYPVFVHRLIRERAESIPSLKAIEAFPAAMGWWEQKLSTSRQIKKWSRSELQEKIDSYKARLQVLE